MKKLMKYLIIPLAVLNACYTFGVKVYFFSPTFIILQFALIVVASFALKTQDELRRRVKILLWIYFGFIIVCSITLLVLTIETPHVLSYYVRGTLAALAVFAATYLLYLILFRREVFRNKAVRGLTIAGIILAVAVLFFNAAVIRITAAPVVFDAGDQYAIVIMTNTSSKATLEITKDGKTKTIVDMYYGIVNASDKYHRFYVDKDDLLGADYKITCKNTYVYQSHNRYVWGREVTTDTYHFNDLREKEGIDYLVFGDIHGGFTYKKPQTNTDNIDFCVINGDTVNFMDSERDAVLLLKNIHNASGGTTPCYYVIGNHEKRGAYTTKILDYVVTPNGTFNYTFEYKDMYAIVMDGGEDFMDDDWIFWGQADYKSYAEWQTAWLTDTVASIPNGRTVVSFIHVPFSDEFESSSGKEFQNWQRLLIDADTKLVMNGHHHPYGFYPAGTEIKNGFTSSLNIVRTGGALENFAIDIEFSHISMKNGKIEINRYLCEKRGTTYIGTDELEI